MSLGDRFGRALARLVPGRAALERERDEARAMQAALSEVLQVIARAPGDLQDVFDTIVANALKVCGAQHGWLMRYDGDAFTVVALSGVEPAYASVLQSEPFRPTPVSLFTRMLETKQPVVADDTKDLPAYRAGQTITVAAVELAGARSALHVPMVRDGALIGSISIFRQEVRPFEAKHIDVVKHFADQAVIAIENARLLTELRESLDRQTATAEVLSVISASPGDVQPVFETMLVNAMRLCEAPCGFIYRLEQGEIIPVAERGIPPAYAEYRRNRSHSGGPGSSIDALMTTRTAIHLHDASASEGYRNKNPNVVAGVELGGARTSLYIPMIKDDAVIGVIHVYRQEVRPFADPQISLIENFAAQAVIAIENARLLNELRGSLDRQTATAEVLRAISASPGQLAPVFDSLLANALRICTAEFGILQLYEGGGFKTAAMQGLSGRFLDVISDTARRPGPLTALSQVIAGKRTVHFPDMAATAAYLRRDPLMVAAVEDGNRALIAVPMLREGELVGAVIIYRREARTFADQEIALVENFAAQAVIAIENARLLNELRARTEELSEALEYQTATSDVLKVISRSTFDLDPVLENVIETAIRLCRAHMGSVFRLDQGIYRWAVGIGLDDAYREIERTTPIAPDRGTVVGRAALERRPVQITDAMNDPDYIAKDDARLTEARTMLGVPLLREGVPIGVIAMARDRVEPFSDKEIELVSTFADQAVIAIENVRLLTELRESLDRQTATSEVLSVISASPGELGPVFDAVLENAIRICAAKCAQLIRYDGTAFYTAATLGVPEAYAEFMRHGPHALDPGSGLDRVFRTKRTLHLRDVSADQSYIDRQPRAVATVAAGLKTELFVPMLKDNDVIGVIIVFREEVRPFTEKQIELVENFAHQAVIAIENARLLTELRQRTDDLQESLDYQTATSDVLKVISRSTVDLDAVLQTVVTSAMRLCRADSAVIYRDQGGEYRWAAGHALLPDYDRIERDVRIRPGPGTAVGRAALSGHTVQIADAWTDPLYEAKEDARIGNVHSMLGVPLLRQGEVIGVIGLARRTIEPFSEREVQLVTTFADQAVIAIENARLFGELRQRTDDLAQSVEELQALGEVTQAINSTLDLPTVLSTIVAKAVEIAATDAGAIYAYDEGGDAFALRATYGLDEATVAAIREQRIGLDIALIGDAAARRGPIEVADLAEAPAGPVTDVVFKAGFRAILVVPLLRPDRIVGLLVVRRRAPGAFAPATVALLQTFAAQSVIAIENARLFTEIEEKGRELAVASQHKSQFLANMSHELRTPLNAILGYTELILDEIYGATPTRMREVLQRVETNGQHLLGLINDVLDLSKIEAGQLTLSLGEYSIKDLVQGVYVAVEPLASSKQLALTLELAPGLPPARGDERRITQVLLNLVGNAIKFTDRGSVVIRAAAENGIVTIAVRDTGPGIAAADQQRIFEEFQQAPSAIAGSKGGTGLGLAISRRIVEMHGGRIWVESAPGAGATFSVTLPVSVAQPVGAA